MVIARSKLTARGRVSVPAVVRKKLGLGPGSVLAWDEEDGKIVVRREGRYSFEDIHKAIFADKPPKRVTIEEMDEGIRSYMREKYGRRGR
jgi:AbrB family looped-hinge helix DNA binding protein